MRKYCLTYDAMKSEEWQSTELKEAILKILIEHGADPKYFEIPTASTILFKDDRDKNAIPYWEAILEGEFIALNKNGKLKTGVFYYICLVAQTKSGDLDAKYDNPNLANSLKELLAKM